MRFSGKNMMKMETMLLKAERCQLQLALAGPQHPCNGLPPPLPGKIQKFYHFHLKFYGSILFSSSPIPPPFFLPKLKYKKLYSSGPQRP